MPPSIPDFSDYHRTVVAFHGTTAEAAERLVNGEPFSESDRDDEWFGKGVYFWEYAFKQAWWWAKSYRKFDRPAVIGASIRLGNCLDLLDPTNTAFLREMYGELTAELVGRGLPVPKNVRRQKWLDCAVMNLVYSECEKQGRPLDAARPVYVNSSKQSRVWDRSSIRVDSHIQLCLRNQRNIVSVWHVREDGRYGKPQRQAETGGG